MIRLGTGLIAAQGQPLVSNLNRFRHTYVLGKTRTGKSTFLQNLIKNDLDNAVIILDPIGSFALDVAGLVDPSRLLYIDKNNPIVFNPLQREEWAVAAKEFSSVMNECVTITTSTRDSTILMNELILEAFKVFQYEHRNIKYLSEFLRSQDTRANHPFISPSSYWKDFDDRKYGRYIWSEKRDSALRVSARLTAFYEDPVLKQFTIGDNQFNVADIAREKKIVVINLSRLDGDSQVYIGNLVGHAIHSYYMYEATEQSPPLHVYIDEFHRFVNQYFDDMFSQSGKYNISINLAHQNHLQIKDNVLNSILGNFHTHVVFNCGYDEAKKMANEYQLRASDFLNLPPYHAYIKIGNKNHKVKSFPPLDVIPFTPPTTMPEVVEPQEELNFLKDAWLSA